MQGLTLNSVSLPRCCRVAATSMLCWCVGDGPCMRCVKQTTEASAQVLSKYIQMSAAALARRQEATEKALAECIDTVASLAAAQTKVPRLTSVSSSSSIAQMDA